MFKRIQHKSTLKRYSFVDGKVMKLSVLTKRIPSRQEKLAQAKKLSSAISKKTVAAGLNVDQIEKDVKRVFKDVKTSRRSSSNRH